MHRALSIKADLAGINLTAASASEAWSRYAALAAPVAMPALPSPNLDFHLEALQAALPADHGLVIFSTEPALAIVVRHDVVRLRMTQLGSRALAKDVSDYRRELQPSSEIDLPGVDLGLGYSLYRRLFGPVEADLAGVRRLILDLPTEFAPLPFAALVTDPSTETSWSTASTQTPPWLALRWETYVVADPMLIPLAQGHRLRLRRPSLLLAGDRLPTGALWQSFRRRLSLRQEARNAPGSSEKCRASTGRGRGNSGRRRAARRRPCRDAHRGRLHHRRAAQGDICQMTHILLATHAVIGSNGQSFLVTTPTDADGGVLSAVNILALPLTRGSHRPFGLQDGRDSERHFELRRNHDVAADCGFEEGRHNLVADCFGGRGRDDRSFLSPASRGSRYRSRIRPKRRRAAPCGRGRRGFASPPCVLGRLRPCRRALSDHEETAHREASAPSR